MSATEPTVIGLDPAAATGLTPEQREQLTITVQPGSMIGPDGQPLAGAQVGISLVPPELVRGMLPPGLMQLATTMTIQAPGVATFSTPVRLTFPNVYGAAPGTKLDVYSFDHTTGRLEITGTATVSADGLSATTDPGSGITHPGWFGTLPQGGCGASNGAPPFSPPLETLRIHEPVVLPFATSDNALFNFPELQWVAPPPTVVTPPLTFGCNPPGRDPGGALFVTIEVDGPLAKFAKPTSGSLPLLSQSFVLAAGSFEDRTFDFEAQTYVEMYGPGGFAQLERDQLYGSVIHVTQVNVDAHGTYTADLFTYYAYRWVDVVDANAAKAKSGATAAFFKTLADGDDGFVRDKLIDAHLPKSQVTKYSSRNTFPGGRSRPG